MARLVGRPDLRWIGLERRISCLPGLRTHCTAAAVVDLETCDRLPDRQDVVLAADLLEHLVQWEKVLALVRVALRPGGSLMVSVPNVANIALRLMLAVGRFELADRGPLDRTHRVFFTRSSLRRELARAGFEIVRESASALPVQLFVPGVLGDALGAIARLAAWARPTLFGYQLVCQARPVPPR